MIKTFKCKETEKLFRGQFSRRLPHDLQRLAARKLEILTAASQLHTLSVPPSNHLEALTGNRLGQHSIRINQQWRLCFRWHEGHAYEVEIVDYHGGPFMNTREFEPITPGEILREEFLLPLQLTPAQLAQGLQVSSDLVQQILDGQRPITAELAVRLGLFFQMEALFWLNLQTRYELLGVQQTRLERLQQEVKPCQVPSLAMAYNAL